MPAQDTQTKKIPKLRFSVFSDEWQAKRLDEFAPLQRGFDLPISQIVAGEYPVVFSNGSLKSHHEYKVEAPGVVTGRSGTIGNVHYIEKNYWPHNTSLWVTDFNGNNPKYVYYIYSNFGLEKYGTGSGVPTLNRNDIHRQIIAVPSRKEQDKIATFLGFVDDKISVLQYKITFLEKYKKGVLQALFSQKIRLKDDGGEDYPSWREKTLGEVGVIVGGGTPDTTNPTFWGGDIYWLTPTEVKSKYISKSKKTITKDGLKNSSAKVLPKGTVIFTSRATVGDIGISTTEIATNQGFQSIIVNDESVNEFVYYWISTNKKLFMRKSSGSTFLEISKNEMTKINIRLPAKQEQQKIADFLRSIDDKIDLTKKELVQAKLFKKALLQQMFV